MLFIRVRTTCQNEVYYTRVKTTDYQKLSKRVTDRRERDTLPDGAGPLEECVLSAEHQLEMVIGISNKSFKMEYVQNGLKTKRNPHCLFLF